MVDRSTACLQGLKATKKFLSSLGRFGNTPFLWSMYGSGELPQAFCRLCAVFGGTYYLGRSVDGIIVNTSEQTKKVEGILTQGLRISCKHLIMGSSNCPQTLLQECDWDTRDIRMRRKICLLSDSISPMEKEQLTFVNLPPVIEGDNSQTKELAKHQTFVQEVGFGPAACPRGMYVLHMTTKEPLDAGPKSQIDIGDILEDSERLLWSVDFTVMSKEVRRKAEHDTSKLNNLYLCCGPLFELDYDLAIENARKMCRKIFPDEEFLPRAPDPEEIVIGGGDDEKDSGSKADSLESVTKETNATENLENENSDRLNDEKNTS